MNIETMPGVHTCKYDLLPLGHDSCSRAAVSADVAAGEYVEPVTMPVHDVLMVEVCYYADYNAHCCAAELDDVECALDYCWSGVDGNADDDCYSVIAIVAVETAAVVAVAADRDVVWYSRPFETDVLG